MRRDSATAVKRRGERELSGAVRRSSPAEPEGRSNFIRYLGHTKIDSGRGRGRGRRDRETEKTSKRATPERGARKIILRDTGGVARPGHDRTTTRPSDPPRGPVAGSTVPFLTGIVVIDSMYIVLSWRNRNELSESKHPSTGSLRRGPSFGLAADGPLGRCAQTRTTARPPQRNRPNPIKGSLPYRVGYPACTRTLGQRHTDECIDLYA